MMVIDKKNFQSKIRKSTLIFFPYLLGIRANWLSKLTPDKNPFYSVKLLPYFQRFP